MHDYKLTFETICVHGIFKWRSTMTDEFNRIYQGYGMTPMEATQECIQSIFNKDILWNMVAEKNL